MAGRRRLAAALGAAVLLGGCQPQPDRVGFSQSAPGPQLTQGAIIQARSQADRFDRDSQQGGMSAVTEDIQRCYRTTARAPVDRLGLRQCLVFDWFACQLNKSVDRQLPGVGDIPFFQQRAIAGRLGRYGPLAGFSDPQVLGGYLAQGSNAIFAIMAARRGR